MSLNQKIVVASVLVAALGGCANYHDRFARDPAGIVAHKDEMTKEELARRVGQRCRVRIIWDTSSQPFKGQLVQCDCYGNLSGWRVLSLSLDPECYLEEMPDNNAVIIKARSTPKPQLAMPGLQPGKTPVQVFMVDTGRARRLGATVKFNLRDGARNYFPDNATMEAIKSGGLDCVEPNKQGGAVFVCKVTHRFKDKPVQVLESGEVYVSQNFLDKHFANRSGEEIWWEGDPDWKRHPLPARPVDKFVLSEGASD